VLIAGGNLGGSGRVNGTVSNGNAANPGGTVAPGDGTGTLTIDGNFTPHSSGKLAIELGGLDPGEFDVLRVLGVANLGGTIDVSLVNGFVPQIGDTFTFLTTTTALGNQGGIALDPADVPFYQLTVNMGPMGTAMLRVIDIPSVGVTGDYNDNGVVDAADYVAWRNANNTSTVLPNDSTPGTVNQADYDVWRASFGRTSGAGAALASAAVPEPSSAAILLLAALTTTMSRRATPRWPRLRHACN
jgi:hypothetical protein